MGKHSRPAESDSDSTDPAVELGPAALAPEASPVGEIRSAINYWDELDG